jgi:uncharacterized protein (TIGR00369 family)
MQNDYLESVKKQFENYKLLAEKTMAQLPDEKLFWQYNQESNSIATIVKHLHGNMLSRWTDFLTADGEKQWRDRDAEFENDIDSKKTVFNLWNEGWSCLFKALNSLEVDDLNKIIFIRNESHTVLDAINRQLTHYSYHIGQIVFLGKMIQTQKWQTLSIAKGESKKFNAAKFSKQNHNEILTQESKKSKKTMNNVLEFLKQQIGKSAEKSTSPLMRWLNPTLISVEEGKLSFQYIVRKEMTNPIGTLHGGTTAAIIDDAIGAAVYSYGENHFYSTINIAVDYFGPAFENDTIISEATVIKKGNQLINAQCEIWNANRSRLLAKGYSNLIKTEMKKQVSKT